MKFEIEIIKWLQSFRNTFFDNLFQFFTMFGEELILIAVIGFVYWSYDKKIGERLGITLFFSLIFNSLLKNIVMRPRPYQADAAITPIRLETAGGYSFPSGHTQGAATLFFGLFYFIKKQWLLILAIMISVLVALSRMYLGVHYLTDVLAGALFGIGFAYLGSRFLTRSFNYVKVYLVSFGIISIVVLVLLLVRYFNELAGVSVFSGDEFYLSVSDLIKAYGAVGGFVFGIIHEKKRVDFTNHRNFPKNIIRFLLGIGIILLVRVGLKALFGLFVTVGSSTGLGLTLVALALDFIRYFLLVFIGIGIYPMLFKKLNI